YYYLKAEYFINPLAMPDSALVAYQIVIDEYDALIAEQDSLILMLQEIDTKIDSLSALPEVLLQDMRTEEEQEEIEAIEEIEDEGKAEADSLRQEPDIDEYEDDAELAEETEAAEESEAVETEEIKSDDPLELRRQAIAQKEQITQRLAPFETTLMRFQDEILPFCYFSIYSLYHEKDKDGEEAENILAIMQEGFPRNIYTRAALSIKNGKVPQLIDPDLEAAEEAFDLALGYYPEAPDSLVQSMESFTESTYPELKLRAFYRLGWYYSFEAPDTTRAQEYLQEVLNTSDSGDYGITVRRFYDGAKYLLRDSGLPDSTAVEAELAAADSTLSLDTEALGDTLIQSMDDAVDAEADTLLQFNNIDESEPPDSLFHTVETNSETEAEAPDSISLPEDEVESPPPDIIKPKEHEEPSPE
ncbi:MAG: hypothetical protein WCY84_01700, partial [Candidatus Cloacimonadaceae bacterium]